MCVAGCLACDTRALKHIAHRSGARLHLKHVQAAWHCSFSVTTMIFHLRVNALPCQFMLCAHWELQLFSSALQPSGCSEKRKICADPFPCVRPRTRAHFRRPGALYALALSCLVLAARTGRQCLYPQRLISRPQYFAGVAESLLRDVHCDLFSCCVV